MKVSLFLPQSGPGDMHAAILSVLLFHSIKLSNLVLLSNYWLIYNPTYFKVKQDINKSITHQFNEMTSHMFTLSLLWITNVVVSSTNISHTRYNILRYFSPELLD